MRKRTKKELIVLIVLVVGSIHKVVNEKLLQTWSNDKLIKIIMEQNKIN